MDVYVYSVLSYEGSDPGTGWPPSKESYRMSTRLGKLKWIEVFYGCPMLQRAQQEICMNDYIGRPNRISFQRSVKQKFLARYLLNSIVFRRPCLLIAEYEVRKLTHKTTFNSLENRKMCGENVLGTESVFNFSRQCLFETFLFPPNI
jgi:hypothetical protein